MNTHTESLDPAGSSTYADETLPPAQEDSAAGGCGDEGELLLPYSAGGPVDADDDDQDETESSLGGGASEGLHVEAAPSRAEFSLDVAEATDEELERAEENDPADPSLPEFEDFENDGSPEFAGLDDGELEFLPELDAPDQAELAPLLGAAAYTLLPVVEKAGRRAIDRAIGKLSKKARKRYRKGRSAMAKAVPLVGTLLDAVRRKEMSFGSTDGAESVYVDDSTTDRIAQTLEMVLGTDDRVRIRATRRDPWRKTCALRIHTADGRVASGSGFFVGPRTVVTAGHCVYSHGNGGWVRKVEVIPGARGSQKPFGSWTSSRVRSVRGWTEHRKPAADYGCILLPPGARTARVGSFGVAAYRDPAMLLKRNVTVAGYPGDKPFAQLWKANDRIQAVTPRRLVYANDTTPGMSGSPVFITRGRSRVVVGIHNYGGRRGNSATRITPSVYRMIERWARAAESGSSS
ncbi:MAG: serine protease [Planctomycetota bacterium]